MNSSPQNPAPSVRRAALIATAIGLTAGAVLWLYVAIAHALRCPGLDPHGPTLPVVALAKADCWSRGDGMRATLDLYADGHLDLGGHVLRRSEITEERLHRWFAKLAGRMPGTGEGDPNGVLRVRADETLPWRDVEQVLAATQWKDVKIWRLQLAVRGPDARSAARWELTLARQIGISCSMGMPPPREVPLFVRPGARFELDGREVASAPALLAALTDLNASEGEDMVLSLLGADDLTWSGMTSALGLVAESGIGWFHLGEITARIDRD